MSEAIKAAFPTHDYPEGGITKREYFAAAAMGMWRVDESDLHALRKGDRPDHVAVARFCLSVADALLTELADQNVKP